MRKKNRRPVKIRKKWVINPRTRVKKSNKIYSRKRRKSRFRKEIEGISHET